MAFSINGRIYHSSLGLALIVLGPAGRGQLRQGLGSHDIFTIKSSASLRTLFFHKYLGNDILLDIYTIRYRQKDALQSLNMTCSKICFLFFKSFVEMLYCL